MAATVALRMRTPSVSGPAVRRAPLPIRSLLLSSGVHAVAVGALVAAALLWRPEPTKTYIVNLTPSVPALGTPAGKTTTPAPPAPPPPRTEERPTPAQSPPPELPTREVAPRTTRATAPEMPPRDVASRPRPAAPPELPARTAAKLPDLPTRDLARAPRPGPKELPPLSQASPPASPARPGPAAATRDAGPPPPAPPLGLPTGSAQGAGTVASVDGNFPFQWYLTAVQRKVYEQWTQPLSGAQGQKAVIVFEISRSGEVTAARVEKTSGNAAYDMAALRAVTGANPLPPLPAEFKGSMIRVHFGFDYTGRG